MREHVRTVALGANPRGDVELTRRFLERARAEGADAVALVGNLSAGGEAEEYAGLLRTLGDAGLPAFYVPGPDDAPVGRYLREAYNAEIVFPFIHGVHGTFAFGPGYVAFAGMGGEIVDEPTRVREEVENLRYPAWEAEYRLKILQELRDYQKVFLLGTRPAHKGLGEPGSEVLAELVNTYTPRLVLCGGESFERVMLGTSLVVQAGDLASGKFTLADLRKQEAREAGLQAPAPSGRYTEK